MKQLRREDFKSEVDYLLALVRQHKQVFLVMEVTKTNGEIISENTCQLLRENYGEPQAN